MKRYGMIYGLLATASVLGGCSVGPKYVRPTVETPAAFSAAPEDWKRAEPQDVSLTSWWEGFGDPTLSQLQNELNAGNLSLKVAEAQYRQAKVVADAAPMALFPTLGASVTSTRRRSGNSNNSNSNTSGSSSSSTTTSNNNSGVSISTTSSATLTTQWEADLWGRIRSQYAGSLASAEASAADVAQARLSLQATLAESYIRLRVTDVDAHKLEEVRKAYERTLKLTESRYAAGVASVVDVEQARAQLKVSEAQAVDLKIQRAQLEHAIAVLLGKAPGAWTLPPVSDLVLKQPEVPYTLPSTLLERRPDIASAERKVAIANANIGVAKAAYFPSLIFNASLGSQSSSAWSSFFSAPATVWSLGPSLALSIFDSGARYVQNEQAKAAYEAAVATYRQTVLTAFQEVEDSLVSSYTLAHEELAQMDGLKAAQRRAKGMDQQEAVGTVSAFDAMSTRITLLNQERTVVDLKGQRLLASVGLIKALGGGW